MEWYRTECGKYKVISMTKDTAQPVLELIRTDFLPDEFLCAGAKVSESPEAVDELLELCADAILDSASVVAIEIATGKVVGCCLNKLQVHEPNSTEKTYFEEFMEKRCKHPSSRIVMDIMIDLDERCNFYQRYNTDCYLELMFLTCSKEHRRNKLAYLCFKASLDIAKKMKDGPVTTITLQDLGSKYSYMKPREVIKKVPKICAALGSAYGTQAIGRMLDFDLLLRVSCSEFTYEGKNFVELVGFDPHLEGIAKIVN